MEDGCTVDAPTSITNRVNRATIINEGKLENRFPSSRT